MMHGMGRLGRVALILVVLVPAIAMAQSEPPSKTLERAIKRYDKQDFYSASIELKKVLAEQSGDSPENLERARFFMAKTLFQIGFYVPSLVTLMQLIDTPGSYNTASYKWVAGLRRHLPDRFLAPAVATLTDEQLGDPSISSSREDLVALQRARMPTPPDLQLVSRNALGCTHPDTATMTVLLDKLRSYDDDFELAEAVRAKLRDHDALAQTLGLAMDKTPDIRDAQRWTAELRRELELLRSSDRAWQTTMIAAEILQELTMQHSIGESEIGRQLRELIDAMATEVPAAAGYKTSPELCVREAPPAFAGAPSRSSMSVQPASRGCGCSSGDSANAGLLVALLALAFRRKSRAASGTRSLPA